VIGEVSYFSSASFALMASKFGRCFGSSLASAYCTTPGAVDEEGGAFRNAAHAESYLRQEAVVGDAVGLGDGMLVVAQEGMVIPSFCAQACWAKGLSPLIP